MDAHDEPEPYLAEIASTISMAAVATWTVSAGAHRALSTRQLLAETGEVPPVLGTSSAMLLPVISSGTLLLLYFLFTYIQSFLVLYMVVAAFGAASMCMLEPVAVLWPRLVHRWRLPRGLAPSTQGATVGASLAAAGLVACWLFTGHWLALDALGVCITVSVVSLVRIPSLKVATMVLVSLFVYDIFWVRGNHEPPGRAPHTTPSASVANCCFCCFYCCCGGCCCGCSCGCCCCCMVSFLYSVSRHLPVLCARGGKQQHIRSSFPSCSSGTT